MKIRSFDLIKNRDGSLNLKKKTLNLETNENMKKEIENIYKNPFKTAPKNNLTSAEKNELKKSILCFKGNKMTSFFQKLQKDEDKIRSKFHKKMSQSGFMQRSLSLKQSREFDEKNELQKLSDQSEIFLQRKDKLLEKVQKQNQIQIGIIEKIFSELSNEVISQIDSFKNNLIQRCQNFLINFQKNVQVLQDQIEIFQNSEIDYSNSIYKGISEKFRIIYKDKDQQKTLKEEKVFQIFYLNKLKFLQKKKLIDFMASLIQKSSNHFPKFAESQNSQEMLNEDIKKLQSTLQKKLKAFQIYFIDQKLPDFSTLKGKYIFTPIISQNGKQIFHNNDNLEKISVKKMNAIEQLNCISVNDQNQIFMGLNNGKIIHFNPVIKKFEKELNFPDYKVNFLTPIESYQQFFDNSVNFFQVSKKKGKQQLKQFIISDQILDSKNELLLWDLNRGNIIKRYLTNQEEQIKEIIDLKDNTSFMTFSKSYVSFYIINQIKPIFELSLENIKDVFFTDVKILIIITNDKIKKYKIVNKFNEKLGKKSFSNIKFQSEFQYQDELQDIAQDEQKLIFLFKQKLELYDLNTLQFLKEIKVNEIFQKIRVIKNYNKKNSCFLLVGSQKILLLKDQETICQYDLKPEENKFDIVKNLIFINFREIFKVLFISKEKSENKNFIFEISFNQFYFEIQQ